MSWVNTLEIVAERSCDVNEKGHRSYTRCFLVQFNDLYDSPAQARVASGIPAIKSSYPGDAIAKCIGISVSFEQEYFYRVTATYNSDAEQYENPLDEPPKYSGTWMEREAIADEDWQGNAVINAAGDRFDPPLMKDDAFEIIRVQRNESFDDFHPADAAGYKFKVNEGEWNGFEPKTVKAMPIQWQTETAVVGESQFEYYVVTYEFAINPETWVTKQPNIGYRKIGLTGDLENILIKNVPVTQPVFLTEDGDDILQPPAAPIMLEFELNEPIDFSYFDFTLPS